MQIETVLKIENEVVKKLENVSNHYDIYKNESGTALYFVGNYDSVVFKVDKDLNVVDC